MILLTIIWAVFFFWGLLTIDSILWLGGFIAMMLSVLAVLINLFEATEIDDKHMEL